MSLKHIMPNELKNYFNKTNNPETQKKFRVCFYILVTLRNNRARSFPHQKHRTKTDSGNHPE